MPKQLFKYRMGEVSLTFQVAETMLSRQVQWTVPDVMAALKERGIKPPSETAVQNAICQLVNKGYLRKLVPPRRGTLGGAPRMVYTPLVKKINAVAGRFGQMNADERPYWRYPHKKNAPTKPKQEDTPMKKGNGDVPSHVEATRPVPASKMVGSEVLKNFKSCLLTALDAIEEAIELADELDKRNSEVEAGISMIAESLGKLRK